MITKRILQSSIIALSFFSISTMYGLTTLQHWDPSPIFSANNCMVPPNSQFLDLVQARIKNETPSKNRAFGINFSGFIQGSSTAYGYNGCDQYGTDCGSPQNGFEMGDFRGTMYPMGLFLGPNPNKNGITIWKTGADPDDGIVNDITCDSIKAFFDGKQECLEDIAMILSGNEAQCDPTCTNAQATTGLIFNNTTTSGTVLCPSIFHAASLARDTVYFGAFSMPIEYRKQGFRWELNFNWGDYVGLTVQSGLANIKQKFVSAYTGQTSVGQTNYGPYSISNVPNIPATGGTSSGPLSSLYNALNQATSVATPNTTAQALFNSQISNNLENILNPECGHSKGICSFDEYSVEDIRFFLTVKYPYETNKYTKDMDGNHWPDMIFTPYAYVAGTAPVAKKIDYCNLLSLPFGNNGHGSIGGAGGMTFDFAESVEVGFEGGVTYFFPRTECNKPFPTHKLQRVLYPFSTEVRTKPGLNGHFKAMMSAYQFMPHVNFWFVYEIIEHRQDCYTVCDSTKAQYFIPSILECKSDWRAQFFNAGLSFDIQPGMQASIAWQQPISPRNAYYPVGLIGSINFMF
ncbi:MAG: hypothetical protein NTZ68_03305 [Candidatus Dependentiae bacterium]|nr:hypothetical protein [Candidatus Dependentiae bacterium]